MKSLWTLMLAASNPSTGIEDCPNELVFNVPKLKQQEAKISNDYARCMSTPHLPLAKQRSARKAECNAKLTGKISDQATHAIGWVNQMAVNFESCETNLKVKRK